MPRASTSRHQTDPRFSSAIAPRRFPEQAKGLKPHQQKQLQRLYQLRLPPNRLVTVEFAQRLGSLTQDLEGQPISVYLNRRGQVIRVGLGSPFETQIPAWELPRQGAERLSGIRCITTQTGEGGPGRKALTAMALQRLDALITLSVSPSGGRLRRGGGATGFVHRAYLAHLVPEGESRWRVSEPLPLGILAEQDLQELVAELEDGFRRQLTARQVDLDQDRAILGGVCRSPGRATRISWMGWRS
jgi:GTP-binding protein HflX (EC 3.1.5.-)